MSAALPRRADGGRPWGLWGLRGAVLTYLALMIAVPLLAVVERGFSAGLRAFWRELSNPIAFDALKLTVTAAAITGAVNLVLGTLTAYALARYRFPGRGVLDSLVDSLPLARAQEEVDERAERPPVARGEVGRRPGAGPRHDHPAPDWGRPIHQ